MTTRPVVLRRGLLATAVLAFAAFCIVQDLRTIDGEWTYVYAYRAAAAAQVPHPDVVTVMGPAVRQAVAAGAAWALAVAIVGTGLTLWLAGRGSVRRADAAWTKEAR